MSRINSKEDVLAGKWHWRIRHVTHRPLSHVTHILKKNESCHTWTQKEWVVEEELKNESGKGSHITCKWVMSNMNELCHIWMSHITYVNEACHIYEWVKSHMDSKRMSRRRGVDEWVGEGESCHIWVSHATYEWVMPHIDFKEMSRRRGFDEWVGEGESFHM